MNRNALVIGSSILLLLGFMYFGYKSIEKYKRFLNVGKYKKFIDVGNFYGPYKDTLNSPDDNSRPMHKYDTHRYRQRKRYHNLGQQVI